MGLGYEEDCERDKGRSETTCSFSTTYITVERVFFRNGYFSELQFSQIFSKTFQTICFFTAQQRMHELLANNKGNHL